MFAVVEQVELAGELALAVDREDVGLPVRAGVVDLDVALEDEEEVDGVLAALEEDRALGQVLDAAEGLRAGDLLLGEAGEGLGLALVGVGGVGGDGGRRHGRGEDVCGGHGGAR
jgi:hypothetical protein